MFIGAIPGISSLVLYSLAPTYQARLLLLAAGAAIGLLGGLILDSVSKTKPSRERDVATTNIVHPLDADESE
jgi:hypothetical protein